MGLWTVKQQNIYTDIIIIFVNLITLNKFLVINGSSVTCRPSAQ